jgi:hypothetical protein
MISFLVAVLVSIQQYDEPAGQLRTIIQKSSAGRRTKKKRNNLPAAAPRVRE